LLEKQGRFDFNKSFGTSSSGAPSPQPAHKLCFPKFDGFGDPLVWLHKAEQFFRAYDTPPAMQVWTAAFYMDGPASQWYFRWEKNLGAAPS
jgi:hypothetical protein